MIFFNEIPFSGAFSIKYEDKARNKVFFSFPRIHFAVPNKSKFRVPVPHVSKRQVPYHIATKFPHESSKRTSTSFPLNSLKIVFTHRTAQVLRKTSLQKKSKNKCLRLESNRSLHMAAITPLQWQNGFKIYSWGECYLDRMESRLKVGTKSERFFKWWN